MHPTWLFEPDVFGETAEPLKTEIRRQGMVCAVARQQSLVTGSFTLAGGRRLAEDACVVAFGSYPYVRYIQQHRAWVSGAWCAAENLDCLTYYRHFDRFLLNRHRLILSGVEAIHQVDRIFALLGRQDEVFVRPTGCQKLFTGRRVHRTAFVGALAPARYDPATLVVLAEPQAISREWRLVVAEGTVIAGSQYLVNGVIELAPKCPQAVWAFGQTMLAEVQWVPDVIFMMDLCESKEQLFLLELNSFSSSALYPCDFRTVVATAGKLARQAWERGRETEGGSNNPLQLTGPA
jgi:hypothetical protein